MVVALGLVVAVSGSAFAFADGASEATPGVLGELTPSKLDKKKYKPVQMLAGVETDLVVNGQQQNPEKEFIEFGKNIKFDFDDLKLCTVPGGTTTEQAKAACPGSDIGSGTAAVKLNQNTTVRDETVTAFAGPNKGQIQLHAYSPTLQASNTQVVLGNIVKAKSSGFGQALSVADAPDAGGDAFAIVEFNATITKASGAVTARCKVKNTPFKREVTYDDNTTETVEISQKCKQKKSNN
jgi:hypothetical protein